MSEAVVNKSLTTQPSNTPRMDVIWNDYLNDDFGYYDYSGQLYLEGQKLERELAAALAEIARLREDKNSAYFERNNLVAALARVYPSGIRRTIIEGWDDDWHGCCFIDLPSGQISYHYHDSHAHLFEKFSPYETPWDGHDKDTVHARLAAIDAALKECKK
jgi:hypothetical protein